MRPIFTLAHTVGALMLLYALGVMATPNGGVTNYLQHNTFLTPPMIAGAFAVCGLLVLCARPAPVVMALLTTPILLYALASAAYLASAPSAALTAVVAHSGVWLVTQAALFEKVRGA